MDRQYVIKTDYEYNVFGADEHYVVYLYRWNGNKYKFVNSWSYSTFMKERLAHWLAEKKIRRLKETYDAAVE